MARPGDVVAGLGILAGIVVLMVTMSENSTAAASTAPSSSKAKIPKSTTGRGSPPVIPTACSAHTYSQGNVGSCVQTIQQLLNHDDAAGLKVDGIFGPVTATAVRNFQTAQGLAVNGIVGPQTWARLVKPAAPGGPGGTDVRPTP